MLLWGSSGVATWEIGGGYPQNHIFKGGFKQFIVIIYLAIKWYTYDQMMMEWDINAILISSLLAIWAGNLL